MKSDTANVQQQFQDRKQFRVPFYQRAYVWRSDTQWAPLWEDILSKTESRLAGETAAPHFLGAIVLEPQRREGLRGVETFHVIDGQQRLTTLQYVLTALRLVIRERQLGDLAPIIGDCLRNGNPETMDEPDVEQFKVWPTFRDRENYRQAMTAENLDQLKERFPESFTQRGTLRQIGITHPPALHAIWFFHDLATSWLDEAEGEDSDNLEALTLAILRDLKFVWIVLDDHDDAQVIFETLNGRGAELHATDLIRNFIFLRADREATDAGDLYERKWRPFEGSFWSEGQRRGRLNRPRLEWFVQTSLQAETGEEVEVGNLYSAYKSYALPAEAPVSAVDQLDMLEEYGKVYQELLAGDGRLPISWFGREIGLWDASATHSVAIRVARSELSDVEQTEIFEDLVSYMVRRAVCGLTAKNYNNVFLNLLKKLNSDSELNPKMFRDHLAEPSGDASRWPRDAEFSHAWMNADAFRNLGAPNRVKSVLIAIENGLRSARTEERFTGDTSILDVEHIMPRSWYEHWPLKGEVIAREEATNAVFAISDDPEFVERRNMILQRENAVNALGNLTLVNNGVNRGLQNFAFARKRDSYFKESNLHLNREIMVADIWDEAAIENRGKKLLGTALNIWMGPERD